MVSPLTLSLGRLLFLGSVENGGGECSGICEWYFSLTLENSLLLFLYIFLLPRFLSLFILELPVTHTTWFYPTDIRCSNPFFSLFLSLCLGLNNCYWSILKFTFFFHCVQSVEIIFKKNLCISHCFIFLIIFIFMLKFPYFPTYFPINHFTYLSCCVFRTCLIILTFGSSLILLLLTIFSFDYIFSWSSKSFIIFWYVSDGILKNGDWNKEYLSRENSRHFILSVCYCRCLSQSKL